LPSDGPRIRIDDGRHDDEDGDDDHDGDHNDDEANDDNVEVVKEDKDQG
jgi:hypothetical protein